MQPKPNRRVSNNMSARVIVLEQEDIVDIPEDSNEVKGVSVDVIGTINSVNGGAALLQCFYDYDDRDQNKEFGYGGSDYGLPDFPMSLDYYKEQTSQVIQL